MGDGRIMIIGFYRWMAGLFVALAIGMAAVGGWMAVGVMLFLALCCLTLAQLYARPPPP